MSGVEVKLRARERILLASLLPKEGDLTTIRIVRELRHSLEFTEDDLERLHIGPPCHVCGEREEQHVELDKEDKSTHSFVANPERIAWDQSCLHCGGAEKGHDDSEHKFESKDFPSPFVLGPKAIRLIKEKLQELSQHKKMTEEILALYDAFYPETPSSETDPIPIGNLQRKPRR